MQFTVLLPGSKGLLQLQKSVQNKSCKMSSTVFVPPFSLYCYPVHRFMSQFRHILHCVEQYKYTQNIIVSCSTFFLFPLSIIAG